MHQDGRAIPGQVLYGPMPRRLGLGTLEVVEDAHQLLGVRTARTGAGKATPPRGDVDGVDGGGDPPHQLGRADVLHPARSKVRGNPVDEPSNDRGATSIGKCTERGWNVKRQLLAREPRENCDLAHPAPTILRRCLAIGKKNGPSSAQTVGIR